MSKHCPTCGGLGYCDRDDTDDDGRYHYRSWDCPTCAKPPREEGDFTGLPIWVEDASGGRWKQPDMEQS